MISKVLSSIDGIASYPIISLMIFLPFFIIVTVWIFRLDKQYLQHMSELPLQDSQEERK
ncbi:MAG: CcoQ/FixQ family Cbb3-type cytochrome c oxidase assembly chaperone [Bacteroidota bacterium]